MATESTSAGVGSLLRGWRDRRRMTQLELALGTGISTRHLSFVETGRSKPGRDTLLRVAEQLDIPYRDRNQILLAAGHAPAFPERRLQDAALAPVRLAIDRILAAHEPLPGMAFDRGWDLVAANASATALVDGVDIDRSLLATGERPSPRPSSARPGAVHHQPRPLARPLSRAALATDRRHRRCGVGGLDGGARRLPGRRRRWRGRR